MKAKQSLVQSIAMAATIAATPVFGAAIPPAAGVYSSYEYVDVATGSDCEHSAGDYFSGYLRWPGAGKPGAVWRYQANGPDGPMVEDAVYPTTPAATSTIWSGTEKWAFRPGGQTGENRFEARLRYVNSRSFTLKRTIKYGNCTEKIFASFVSE